MMLSHHIVLIFSLIFLSTSCQVLKNTSQSNLRFLSQHLSKERLSFSCESGASCNLQSTNGIIYILFLDPQSKISATLDINNENRNITITYDPGSSSTSTATSLYLDCLNNPPLQLTVPEPTQGPWSLSISNSYTQECKGTVRFVLENPTVFYHSVVSYQITVSELDFVKSEQDNRLVIIPCPIIGFMLMILVLCCWYQYRKRLERNIEQVMLEIEAGPTQSSVEASQKSQQGQSIPLKKYQEFEFTSPSLASTGISLDEPSKDNLLTKLLREN